MSQDPDQVPHEPKPNTRARRRASTGIRYLGDLKRLVVRPGDRFVLSVNAIFTLSQHAALKAHLDKYLDGAPVLVLDRGMKLGVAGPQAAAQKHSNEWVHRELKRACRDALNNLPKDGECAQYVRSVLDIAEGRA